MGTLLWLLSEGRFFRFSPRGFGVVFFVEFSCSELLFIMRRATATTETLLRWHIVFLAYDNNRGTRFCDCVIFLQHFRCKDRMTFFSKRGTSQLRTSRHTRWGGTDPDQLSRLGLRRVLPGLVEAWRTWGFSSGTFSRFVWQRHSKCTLFGRRGT